jgi:hypothetical protein
MLPTLFVALLFACLAPGVVLLILAVRWRERGLLRTFWILAGASTIGLALGAVLHNLFYALGTVTEQWRVLHGIVETLGAVAFVISVPISPLGFLVGVAGAIVRLVQRSREMPVAV